MPPSAPRPSLRCPGEVGPALPWSLLASPQLPPPPGWAVSAPGAGGGSRADARSVLQGAASACGWAGIQRTPDPDEMAPKSGAGPSRAQGCWKHLHTQPGVARTALGTVPIHLFLKRGWSRAGTGHEHGPALQVPAGAAAGGGGLRIPSPGRAAAWQRRPKTRHAKAGEWPQALPFACPHGALPLLRWALPPSRSSPGCCHPARPPPPPASGVFAIPSSSLWIISHFFPYHHP